MYLPYLAVLRSDKEMVRDIFDDADVFEWATRLFEPLVAGARTEYKYGHPRHSARVLSTKLCLCIERYKERV